MKLNIKNIITSLLLLFPAWVFADVHTGIELTKEATYDYSTQTGIIKLENFVGQVTKTINLGKNADVVLIVDGSRSMNPYNPESTTTSGGNWGMDALCNAVNQFASQLITASTGSIDHHLSLIVFAGNCRLLCDLTSVKGKTASYFEGLLKDVCTTVTDANGVSHVGPYGGGTMAHMALGLSSYVITKSTDLSNSVSGTGTNQSWVPTWICSSAPSAARPAADCNRYVVFMTDGALEGQALNADGSNYSPNIAHGGDNSAYETQAVNMAKALKNSANATVYSIGFLSASEATNGLNNYLNNVSSNIPAGYAETLNSDTPADYIPHDYYIRVDRSGGDLSGIFSQVSEEIVAGCAAVQLNPDYSTVTDVINDAYFKLPAGIASVSDLLAHPDFKAYAIPCKGYEQKSTGPEYTWSTNASDKVDYTDFTTKFGKALSFSLTDGKSITVSGFDFSENWCGLEYVSGDGSSRSTKAHGYKLVIEIPYTVKNYEGVTAEVPTNAAGSGFNGKTTGGDDLFQAYGTPKIPLFELTVTRKGLRAGESAIYTIRDKDDKVLNTIVLTGTGSDVKQKVLYVPDGAIKVEETNWGWNNSTSSTNPQSYTLSTTNPSHEYIFNGASSPGKQNANPEDHKKNEFSK